jgi:hypothetical protein
VTNTGSPVILDIDVMLVESHSENKAGTAATYKSGFGFHTLLCFADATGETMAALLRPGNAGGQHQRRSPVRVGRGSSSSSWRHCRGRRRPVRHRLGHLPTAREVRRQQHPG